MNAQNVTLSIPAALYEQLKQRAAERRRSLEDETLDLLASAVPGDAPLPDELAAAVSSLPLLDDTALWQAARSHLAEEAAEALAELHRKRQRAALTDTERETMDSLVREYERAMLVRAKAAALLHERGHDISELTPAR